MRNSMLKRVVGALLCTAILLASFSVYAFAAKEPQSTNRSSDTVSFGVQTVQFIESRTEITADGTQRRYGTLAFSFEVENRNATLPAAQQEAVPHWYVEHAQCAVYESSTDPARLILTVQGVLQDENWARVPFSGSGEYYF